MLTPGVNCDCETFTVQWKHQFEDSHCRTTAHTTTVLLQYYFITSHDLSHVINTLL